MKFRYKYSILIGSIILTLSACVTKKYERPQLTSVGLYRDNNTTDTTTMADLPWKSLFSDTTLQSLIQQGINQNLDLKQAIERIKISEATLRQSRAAFLPSLQADVSVTDNKASASAQNFPAGININLETQTYRAQLSTAWEADIWGKLSSAKRAAFATLLQSDAAKRAVQTQLIATIANSYYTL
ncbi:MAG: TolC family protein, partial [Pedobacter sp.]